MPILTIQQSLREVGRLRLGETVTTRSGKRAPAKLGKWRFTSANRRALEVAAEHYGGTIRKWDGAPVGDQWELYSNTDVLDVVVPPDELSLSQWFEHWSGGGCLRRCDGRTEHLTEEPCLCAGEEGARLCKATTRLSVILGDVPGLGVWRLETHSYYAATELPGAFELLAMAYQRGGRLIPAKLIITQREQKVPGEATRQYIVPALDVPLTVYELAAAAGVPSLGGGVAQLPAAPGAAVSATFTPTPIDGTTSAVLTPLERAEHVFNDPGQLRAADAPRRTKQKKTADLPPVDLDADPFADEPPPPPPPDEPSGTAEAPVRPPRGREDPVATPGGGRMSQGQQRALMAVCKRIGLTDRADRLTVSSGVLGRTVPTSSDLTAGDASVLLDVFGAVERNEFEFVIDNEARPVGVRPITPEEPS